MESPSLASSGATLEKAVAALDEITASPVEDISYFDTPLYCHLIGTGATRDRYVALALQKKALTPAPAAAPTGTNTGTAHPPNPRGHTAHDFFFGSPDAGLSTSDPQDDEEPFTYRSATYSPAEAVSLAAALRQQPGVRSGRLRAILGGVRFVEGYYLVGITQRRQVARIGAHRIFEVCDVQLLSLTLDPQRLARLCEAAAGASGPTSSAGGPRPSVASALAAAVAASSVALVTRRSLEETYRDQFLSQHARRGFFYSHTYDLTHTLQANMTTAAETLEESGPGTDSCEESSLDASEASDRSSSEGEESEAGMDSEEVSGSDGSGSAGSRAPVRVVRRRWRAKYVWNEFLLEPFLASVDRDDDEERAELESVALSDGAEASSLGGHAGTAESFIGRARVSYKSPPNPRFASESVRRDWAVYMIRGAVVQRAVAVGPPAAGSGGRRLLLTLIARVSKEAAGTRYLRRGVNADGHVANHVEVEQVLCEEASLNTHYTRGTFSSYVQVRGSVPVRWYHPPSASMPKPPILVAESGDLHHNAACRHFQELLVDYGAPVVAMDFLKRSDGRRREAALGDAYRDVVCFLRGHIAMHTESHTSADDILRYRAVDLRRAAGRAWNAVTAMAARDTVDVAHFTCRADGVVVTAQRGVVRSNCVDCIDRTNIGQFLIALHVLGRQLQSLGLVGRPSDLVESPTVGEELLAMYLAVGDALALQYGGSAQVGAGVLHRGAGWDQAMGLQRLYANALGDARKQAVLSLYLGRLQPDPMGLRGLRGVPSRGGAPGPASRARNQHLRMTPVGRLRGRPHQDTTVTATSALLAGSGSTNDLAAVAVASAQAGELLVLDAAEGGTEAGSGAGGSNNPGGQATPPIPAPDEGEGDTEDGAASLMASTATVPSLALASFAHEAGGAMHGDGARGGGRAVQAGRTLLQRLHEAARGTFAGPRAHSASLASSFASTPTRPAAGGQPRVRLRAGEAEADYYLHVRGGPELPSPALPRHWWLGPLRYRAKLAHAQRRRRWPRVLAGVVEVQRGRVGEVLATPSIDGALAEQRSRLAVQQRDLSLGLCGDDRGRGGALDAASGGVGVHTHGDGGAGGGRDEDALLAGREGLSVLFPTSAVETEWETDAGVGRAAARPWEVLVARLSLTRPPSDGLLGVSNGTRQGGGALPVRQQPFTHDHVAFPGHVWRSMYATTASGGAYASLFPSCAAVGDGNPGRPARRRGTMNDADTLTARGAVAVFGPPHEWSPETVVSAVAWAVPKITKATRECLWQHGVTGAELLATVGALDGLPGIPDAHRSYLRTFASSLRLLLRRHRGAEPSLSDEHLVDASRAQSHRRSVPQWETNTSASVVHATLLFLQPLFLERLTEDTLFDQLHDWKYRCLLHSTVGVPHRDHVRYTGHTRQSPHMARRTASPSSTTGSSASTASAPAATTSTTTAAPTTSATTTGTPPIPQAVCVPACVSPYELYRWLLQHSAALGLALHTLPDAPRHAWVLVWWLLLAGLAVPAGSLGAVSSYGVPAAQAWALLTDDTCLLRIDGYRRTRGGGQDASVALNRRACVPLVDAPSALAESLASAALSALSTVLQAPVKAGALFVDLAQSLVEALAEGAAALAGVDIVTMDAAELLPFWVNVYNALYTHAWLLASLPAGSGRNVHGCRPSEARDEDLLSFLKSHGYFIGRVCFTLHEIKFGILLGNTAPRGECMPPFPPKVYASTVHRLTPLELRLRNDRITPACRRSTDDGVWDASNGSGKEEFQACIDNDTLAALLVLADRWERAHVFDLVRPTSVEVPYAGDDPLSRVSEVASTLSVAEDDAMATDITPEGVRQALEHLYTLVEEDARVYMTRRVLIGLLDAYVPPPLASTAALLTPGASTSSGGVGSAFTVTRAATGGGWGSFSGGSSPGLLAPTSGDYAAVMTEVHTWLTSSESSGTPVDVLQRCGYRLPHAPEDGPPEPCRPTDVSHASGPLYTTGDGWASAEAATFSPAIPRRVRLLFYLQLHTPDLTEGRDAGLAGRTPTPVAHLCAVLLKPTVVSQLLDGERSLLHTILSAGGAPAAAAPLLERLCVGHPQLFGSSVGDVTERLRASQRSGARATRAAALLASLASSTATTDFSWAAWRRAAVALASSTKPAEGRGANTEVWRCALPRPSVPAASFRVDRCTSPLFTCE